MDAVVRWCAHDVIARTAALLVLVRCIRFALMSPAELQSLLTTFGQQTPAIRGRINDFCIQNNDNNNNHIYSPVFCLQCFDAVGWEAGRASGL